LRLGARQNSTLFYAFRPAAGSAKKKRNKPNYAVLPVESTALAVGRIRILQNSTLFCRVAGSTKKKTKQTQLGGSP
jgi:hypothetical protein